MSVLDTLAGTLLEQGVTVLGQHVSYAELIGQLCALLVVLFAQRRSTMAWPVQILAAALLFGVYTGATLGGLAARQVVIIAISLLGWWRWHRSKRRYRHRRFDSPGGGDTAAGSLAVRVASGRERMVLLAGMLVSWVVVALVLQQLDASWAPWPDAWIFVGTVTALLAQGMAVVEFWYVWLAVDAVGVPLQLASGLWFSAAVYVVFAGLVVAGIRRWRAAAEAQSAQAPRATCSSAARGVDAR